MTDPSQEQDHADGSGNQRVTGTGAVVHRKVSVKGSGGVTAAIVVTVRRGWVSVAIDPPFTWESIMEPGKVDELIRTLTSAAEDARKMVRGKAGSSGGRQPIGDGIVPAGSDVMDTKKARP